MLCNKPFYLRGKKHEGHAYLMLHGLGGGIYEMKPLGYELNAAGFTVQGINYPGHDEPATHMPTSAWEDWYSHALDTYHDLKKDCDTVSFVGFSTGCMIGLHLASDEDIKDMVMLSPFMRLRHFWFYGLRPEDYVRRLSPWVSNVPRRGVPITDRQMAMAANQVAWYSSFNLPSVMSALELIDRVDQRLETIQNPALIIHSKRDSVVCPSGALRINQRLASEQKDLVWLKRSDHVITLDVERGHVLNQVQGFALRNLEMVRDVAS
jgi:carboxylesterase